MNNITSAFRDDENSITVPTDGYLTIATADSCDLSFDDAEHTEHLNVLRNTKGGNTDDDDYRINEKKSSKVMDPELTPHGIDNENEEKENLRIP